MKIILIVICLIAGCSKTFAQVEPENNDQKLRDSSIKTDHQNLNVTDSAKWIDISVKPSSIYYIYTKHFFIDSVAFGFESRNKNVFLQLDGTETFIEAINEHDKIIFVFGEKDKLTIRSVQKHHEGYSGGSGDVFLHGYNISTHALTSLSNKTLKTILISKNDSYITLNLKPFDAENLKQLASTFLNEFTTKVLKK